MIAPITTRAEQVMRRKQVPLGSMEYDQSSIGKYTGVRADCSGWYWWYICGGTYTTGDGFYLGAPSTESLHRLGLIYEIDSDELLPGDAIGYCGPGSANGGGGHIAPYLGRSGDRFEVLDHGSGFGPKHRFVIRNKNSTGWLAPNKCKAWRYVNMEEAGMRFIRDTSTSAIYEVKGISPAGKIELAHVRDIASWQLLLSLGYTYTMVPSLHPDTFDILTPNGLRDLITDAVSGGIDVRVTVDTALPPVS